MNLFQSCRPILKHFTMIVFWSVAGVLLASTNSLGNQDFLPQEIRGLEMGADPAAVIARIKDTGSYTRQEYPQGFRFRTAIEIPTGQLTRRIVIRDQKRHQLIWTPPSGTYYNAVTFFFTEKLRLYMIRFTLADSRRDALKLKKSFLDEFKVPEENPMRISRPHMDALFYGPAENHDFFIEMTDPKTGQKNFELFRRQISAEDRPRKKSAVKKKAESSSTAESSKP